MKLILQHIHLKNVVLGPSDPPTIGEDRVDHIVIVDQAIISFMFSYLVCFNVAHFQTIFV